MTANSVPELFTNRLLLRPLRESDAKPIFELRKDPEINRFVVRKSPVDLIDALDFIGKINKGAQEGKWKYWALILKSGNLLIGTISLWNFSEDRAVAEVGFDLMPAYQRKGYMTDALRAVISYGFDVLGLQKIDAYAHPENFASHKLLVSAGFRQQPTGLEPLLKPLKAFELPLSGYDRPNR